MVKISAMNAELWFGWKMYMGDVEEWLSTEPPMHLEALVEQRINAFYNAFMLGKLWS